MKRVHQVAYAQHIEGVWYCSTYVKIIYVKLKVEKLKNGDLKEIFFLVVVSFFF